MRKIRAEKEFVLRWSGILTNGEPESLEGRELALYLINPYGSATAQDIEIENNTITARISAGTCNVLGQYRLKLYENKGKSGQTVLDHCEGFVVVPTTCQEGDNTPGLDIDTVELSGGDMAIGIQGKSAYEIAVENGFEGTEEEWLESLKGKDGKDFTYSDFTPEQIAELQRPATEAAQLASQAASKADAAAQKATEAASVASQTEASIKQAETARVSAEQQRVTKETERQQAETERKQAEQGRATAEQGRVSAESNRTTAEQGRASAEQHRVTEFAALKQESETATTEATKAADEANKAAQSVQGITDRLSETYPHFAAIQESGETNPNKIYIDAEKQTSYIYLNGEYVSVGGGKGSSFPPVINSFTGKCYTIPFEARYSLKFIDWISLVWNNLEGSDGHTLIEYFNSDSDYISIRKSGWQTQVDIKTANGKSLFLQTSSSANLQQRWNAITININERKYEAYHNGELVYSGDFQTINGEATTEDLSDTYKSILLMKNSVKTLSLVGLLNYKLTEDTVSKLYNNGLYYTNPIDTNSLATHTGWDKEDYMSQKVYLSTGGTYTREDGKIICNLTSVGNNRYVRGPNSYFNLLGKAFSTYLKIKVNSGKIKLVGHGTNGRIKADIYNASNNELIGNSNSLPELGVGEYYAKSEHNTTNEGATSHYINFNVVEIGEVEFSEMKTKIEGYALCCAISQISGGVCRINADTYVDFEGTLSDKEYIKPTKFSSNTNVTSDFAGQNLIVGEDVYVAIKGGQKLWKKITP